MKQKPVQKKTAKKAATKAVTKLKKAVKKSAKKHSRVAAPVVVDTALDDYEEEEEEEEEESYGSYGYGWYYRPYVSVATRRAKAAKAAAKAKRAGRTVSPVVIKGRTIAHTFWGRAWCTHLESYSDYANRLPRGRTYVRNGSVFDLQMAAGSVTAMVSGSSVYRVKIKISPVAKPQWRALSAKCAGQIGSVVELLRGTLSDGVMRMVTGREGGLFPTPREIDMNCSCPDGAYMCKHLAAVLYGVGARLDTKPELLFTLRQANHLELITAAAQPRLAGTSKSRADRGTPTIATGELSEVFGIDLADSAAPPSTSRKKPRATKGKAAELAR